MRSTSSLAASTEGAIQVNSAGERFGNEHEGHSESALFVLAQPDGIAFNIYDERIHEAGLGMPNYIEAIRLGLIRRASTLRELADLLAIDASGLEQTLALVNALAFDNDADDFGRSFRASQMILGPFYGVRVTGALLGSEGGLAIDAGGRVMRADGSALPNLLAAGGAARGISGDAGGGYHVGASRLRSGGRLHGPSRHAHVRPPVRPDRALPRACQSGVLPGHRSPAFGVKDADAAPRR